MLRYGTCILVQFLKLLQAQGKTVKGCMDESDTPVPLLRCLISITITKFITLEDWNTMPDAINGAKSVLTAGSVISKEGKFVSIIRFVKYIVRYIICFYSYVPLHTRMVSKYCQGSECVQFYLHSSSASKWAVHFCIYVIYSTDTTAQVLKVKDTKV
jgi:hypothetical protein